jgi:hypothetical protein
MSWLEISSEQRFGMNFSFDRLKEALFKLVREALKRVDYYALYPSKVVKQDANGNLELQPEDSRIAAPTGVPIRLGIPGAKVEVQAGGRVLLGFENGDPRFPVALLWDLTTVTKLELNATEIVLNGGSKKVAREDDSVDIGTLSGGNSGGPVLFVFTPAGGGLPITLTTITISGKIATGAAGVKA